MGVCVCVCALAAKERKGQGPWEYLEINRTWVNNQANILIKSHLSESSFFLLKINYLILLLSQLARSDSISVISEHWLRAERKFMDFSVLSSVQKSTSVPFKVKDFLVQCYRKH